MRMHVWSLALLSGLRSQCCSEWWCRSQMWLASHVAVVQASIYSSISTPLTWEISYASGAALKSKKEKRKMKASEIGRYPELSQWVQYSHRNYKLEEESKTMNLNNNTEDRCVKYLTHTCWLWGWRKEQTGNGLQKRARKRFHFYHWKYIMPQPEWDRMYWSSPKD